MGVLKNLAIGFGVAAGAPVVAAAVYLGCIYSKTYECDTVPGSDTKLTGAMVVRWNFPPLIGERGGRYSVALKDANDNIAYSEDGNDRSALENKARHFCATGQFKRTPY